MNIITKYKNLYNFSYPILRNFKGLEFHTRTSDFNENDLNSLKIKYKNCDNIKHMIKDYDENIKIPDHYLLPNIKREDILYNAKLDSIDSKIAKSLFKYIKRSAENESLKIKTRETITDSMVNFILTQLEFNIYPFEFRIHPDYKFSIGDIDINSYPEFSIEKENSENESIVLMFDEDKHFNNIGVGKQWGEYQIAGEFVACAYNNYNHTGNDQTIYSMRVISTKFTFYKAFFKKSYLKSLSDGEPNEEVSILKYPINNSVRYIGLDIADEKDRIEIFKILFNLKNELKNMNV